MRKIQIIERKIERDMIFCEKKCFDFSFHLQRIILYTINQGVIPLTPFEGGTGLTWKTILPFYRSIYFLT